MSIKTLLARIGEDTLHGLHLVLPFSMGAASILSLFFPLLGPAINVGFIAVVSAEQAFKNTPKSGPQKLAFAMTIAEPILKQYMPEGVAVEAVLEKVVELLNRVDENGQALPATT